VGVIGFAAAVILLGRLTLWGLEQGLGAPPDSLAGADGYPLWRQTNTGAFWALSIVVCGAAELGALALWAVAWSRRGGDWRPTLGLRSARLGELGCWAGLAALFALGCDMATWAVGRPVVPDAMREAYATVGSAGLFWLALVGVAPLVEEVVFRGLLYGGVEAAVGGRWSAIVLTTGVWTGLHGQYGLWDLSIVVSAGLLLGWARSRTGSVFVTWIMHAVLNGIAVTEVVWNAELPRGG
jgi:hypothetical protein